MKTTVDWSINLLINLPSGEASIMTENIKLKMIKLNPMCLLFYIELIDFLNYICKIHKSEIWNESKNISHNSYTFD